MRDFMKHHRQGRCQPDVEIDGIRRADDDAVDKIVRAVGDQVHITHRMHSMIRAEHVLMPPEQKLFEHKKRENSGKHQD
jgi:hypothetical protein